jgi:hypothetical protein
MKIENIKSRADLETYLRTVNNFRGDGSDPIYDFNGIIRLFLALVDNLNQYGLEQEFKDIACIFSDEQRKFFTKLAEYANNVTDEACD